MMPWLQTWKDENRVLATHFHEKTGAKEFGNKDRERFFG
jgi:NADH:ubiquinone oxidoreductase subunit